MTSPSHVPIISGSLLGTREITAGDVIFVPDREKHWHGARADRYLTHLSITEGPPHLGMHVTDAECAGRSNS